MSRFRIVVPISLVATAIAIAVIGPTIQRSSSDTPVQDVKNDDPVSPTPRQDPVYDEEGRQVLVVGEISLHIPASTNAVSTGAATPESNMVQVTLCWPREEETGECPGIENVVIIYLTGGIRQPIAYDGMTKLKEEITVSDGPYDSDMTGIWEFRQPSSDNIYHYAIIEPDPTGRHVVARCYAGPRCRSWISVVPGLMAQYDFDKRNLPIWPAIDQQVRSYVKSLLDDSGVD